MHTDEHLPPCLTCPRVGVRRGLCHRCYQACCTQVRRGNLTWDEAEAAGLARPARKRGPWLDKFREVIPAKSRPPQDVARPAEPGAGISAE